MRNKYVIKTVASTTMYASARKAVLIPITGKPERGFGLPLVQYLFDTVRWKWIYRLESLNKAGWDVIRHKKNHAYAVNCPPFGVSTDDTAAKCRRPAVCPFCYARERVLNVYRRFSALLFGDDPPVDKKGVKLVWFRRYTHDAFSKLVPEPFGPATASDYMARFVAFARKHRRDVLKLTKAKRASVLFTPFPGKSGGLSVRWSGVLLLEKGVSLDKLVAFPFKVGVLDPSKKNLGTCLNKAMRYLRAMMYDDPEKMALILNGVKNVRLLSHYGPRVK